jgi:hypothetical protein
VEGSEFHAITVYDTHADLMYTAIYVALSPHESLVWVSQNAQEGVPSAGSPGGKFREAQRF